MVDYHLHLVTSGGRNPMMGEKGLGIPPMYNAMDYLVFFFFFDWLFGLTV